MPLKPPLGFAARKSKAATRSLVGKASAVAQAKTLLNQIDAVELSVSVLSASDLLTAAIDSYNDHQDHKCVERMGRDGSCEEFRLADQDSAPSFLERIQVNYIRHNLTTYDSFLLEVAGRIGVVDGVEAIVDQGSLGSAIVLDLNGDGAPDIAGTTTIGVARLLNTGHDKAQLI